MTEGHGKVGGSVVQKGRSGFFVRNKVTPVNVQSPYQQQVRSYLAYFSSKFRTLGSTVVAAWNSAASTGFTSTNVFGNSFKKTGHALYVGLNINLSIIEQAELTNPPSPEGVPSPLTLDPAAAFGAATFFLNAGFVGGVDVIPANTSMVFMASPPLSGGVSFVKSQLRIVSYQAAGVDTGTDNLWTEYVGRFGAPPAGSRLAVQVVTINEDTGEAGIPFKQIITVAA